MSPWFSGTLIGCAVTLCTYKSRIFYVNHFQRAIHVNKELQATKLSICFHRHNTDDNVLTTIENTHWAALSSCYCQELPVSSVVLSQLLTGHLNIYSRSFSMNELFLLCELSEEKKVLNTNVCEAMATLHYFHSSSK